MIAKGRLLPVALLFFVMPLLEFSSVEDVAEEQKQLVVDPEYTDDEQRNCHNVDIRNNLARLALIKNCTVITGFLQLVLIERVPQQDFAEYRFDKLREVTGFILFFRVFNLVTLRDMFPNLMMIRGQKLIGNYALIFYDLRDFHEIGLKNLYSIQRGFVYSQWCPNLCYTDKIDWASITQSSNRTSRDLNMFQKNSATCNKTECPGCEKPFCWTNLSCQKFHTGYSYKGKLPKYKCHEQCLGGCYNGTAEGCYVCRGPKEGKRCVEKCSPDKVLFHDSLRCISKQKCINRGGLVFRGECLDECPAGYSPDNVEQVDADFSNHTCYPCHNRCPKICEGMQVMYLSDAVQLAGCTIINGTLQIRLLDDHPNVLEELRENLGGIEEIMGYLKVYRSNTLSSLDFLENLAVIHGLHLGNDNYSLMVYENANLQKLWNFEFKSSLRLLAGSMYFVYNPLLCYSQVRLLQGITMYNSTSDLIDRNTLGFMQSCNVVPLVIRFAVLSSRNVTISWTKYRPQQKQQLVGFIIYFTATEFKRSPHDGRDICSEYSWQSKLVLMKEIVSEGAYYSYNLTGLKPSTRYAYYVKTYISDDSPTNTTTTDMRIGQSDVKYFVTKIDRPTQPLTVYTVRKTDHSITFSWKILTSEVRLVKRFMVDVFIQPDERALLDQRNYCVHPHDFDNDESDGDVFKTLSETCTAEQCCTGNDFMANVPDMSRKKRSTTANQPSFLQDEFQQKMYRFLEGPSSQDPILAPHRAKRDSELVNRVHNHSFDATLGEFTVSNLLPYTYYTFQLFACSADELEFCSAYSIYSDRTAPSPVVGTLTLTVIKQPEGASNIVLTFTEPVLVNGAVVAYNIELKSIAQTVSVERHECITRLQHEQAGGRYVFGNLTAGEYMVRARVISLAGPAPFSDWYFAEVVWREPLKEDKSVRNGLITFGVLLGLSVVLIGLYAAYHRFKTHHDDKAPLVEDDGNALVDEDGFVDCALR
ncbi:insulin-like peptide receptor isoform X1 [Culex quinquefasciatus]|uniref:insulin-like peptide receptor isoform X1 n=2 Tax=Culex quinquefasciatus TaxID=7176 RepID=UPI0018E37731|nr:insulin-like peptide receptor isoform X1 [Culex quinquefasciatus]